MPAAERLRRAGFPTARVLAIVLALLLGSVPPSGAALLPPSHRLPIIFDRASWTKAPDQDRPVPVRPAGGPVTFEGSSRGRS